VLAGFWKGEAVNADLDVGSGAAEPKTMRAVLVNLGKAGVFADDLALVDVVTDRGMSSTVLLVRLWGFES
jgi:hypothetical protein